MPLRLRRLSKRDVEGRRRIGAECRRAREARGLTLTYVADQAGISDATLNRIEKGKQVITTDVLDRIGTVLNIAGPTLYRRSTRATG